jgi:hypothetical protein
MQSSPVAGARQRRSLDLQFGLNRQHCASCRRSTSARISATLGRSTSRSGGEYAEKFRLLARRCWSKPVWRMSGKPLTTACQQRQYVSLALSVPGPGCALELLVRATGVLLV